VKRAAVIAGLLLLQTLDARAQVAAPGLLPFANPATLSWELSSFVSATLLDVEQSAKRNGAPAPDREGSGSGGLLRGRHPGEPLALGLYFLDAEAELGDAAVGTTKQGLRTFAFGVSTRAGEAVALGAGLEGVEEREATATSDRELGTLTPLLGASLRLAEVFYLATVYGRRRLKSNIPERDGQERNMTRIGAGVRWLGPSMLVHAEYHREDSPPFRDVSFAALPGFTFDVMDTRVDTMIAEVVWRGMFLGHSVADTETLGHPLKDETIRTRLVTAGILAPRGLSVTLTWRVEETDDRVKKTDERLEVLALGLYWRF
jgi:hypothetical protein